MIKNYGTIGEVLSQGTHAKYESPMSNGKKVMGRVRVFLNVGQRSRSRSRDQNLRYCRKGLVIRKILAKYQSPMSNGKKVMGRVKVF